MYCGPESAGAAGAAFATPVLTPMLFDMGSFAGIARPLRNAITAARHAGPVIVPKYGARYRESPIAQKVAGRR